MTRRWLGDQAGQVTALWAIVSLALLVLGGVVYDGGQILAARRSAHNLAGQAARAGAQAVDLDAVLRGGVTLDPAAARAAAETFLADRGTTGVVEVTGSVVVVTVELRQPTPLLALVGIDERTVRAVASADVVRGVTAGDAS
jgi:Flp pilus assembly protein TadG